VAAAQAPKPGVKFLELVISTKPTSREVPRVPNSTYRVGYFIDKIWGLDTSDEKKRKDIYI
jgi:hypothetical protein